MHNTTEHNTTLHYNTLLHHTTTTTATASATTLHQLHYITTTLQLQLHYTTLQIQKTNATALHHTTSSSCGEVTAASIAATPKTQIQPPFGPSLCHRWVTATNLSYRFPIFETSATTLCGTSGIYIHIYICIILFLPNDTVSPFTFHVAILTWGSTGSSPQSIWRIHAVRPELSQTALAMGVSSSWPWPTTRGPQGPESGTSWFLEMKQS